MVASTLSIPRPTTRTCPWLPRSLLPRFWVRPEASPQSRPMPVAPSKSCGSRWRESLKLKWKAGTLVWDRDHWSTPFANKSLLDVLNEVNQRLKERGVSIPEKNNRLAVMRVQHDQPHALLLFENLQAVASRVSPRRASGSSGSHGNLRKRLSVNGFDADLSVAGDQYDFNLYETERDGRVLRVSSDVENHLRIMLMHEAHVMVFDQQIDGSVRLVDVRDEKVTSRTAASFAQLYRESPSAIEANMFSDLRGLGFLLPPTRFEPQVVERLMRQLTVRRPDSRRQFEFLLERAGSNSFSDRAQAMRELQENFTEYLPLLVEASGEQTLPLEVKTRLEHVLELYGAEARELDTMVAQLRLADDPDYLSRLLDQLPDADSRQRVVTQLRNLTGQDFGNDAQAWQAWLATR